MDDSSLYYVVSSDSSHVIEQAEIITPAAPTSLSVHNLAEDIDDTWLHNVASCDSSRPNEQEDNLSPEVPIPVCDYNNAGQSKLPYGRMNKPQLWEDAEVMDDTSLHNVGSSHSINASEPEENVTQESHTTSCNDNIEVFTEDIDDTWLHNVESCDSSRPNEQEDNLAPVVHTTSCDDNIEVSDFETWAIAQKLKNETISTLKDEELADIDTLKHITDASLKKLQIKTGQLILLQKGIQELKVSDIVETEFTRFLSEKQVKQHTMYKLMQKEYDSRETVVLMKKEDVDELDISPAQGRLLLHIIEELKSDAPVFCRNEVPDAGFDTNRSPQHDSEGSYTITQTPSSGFDRTLCATAIPGLALQEEATAEKIFTTRFSFRRFKNKTQSWFRTSVESFKTQFSAKTEAITVTGTEQAESRSTSVDGLKIIKLPLREEYENEEAKVRRCVIGLPSLKDDQKTIMLVGATGSGKSTLIDGLCNYVYDTKWEDLYRYKLIDEHAEERENLAKGQSQSQTEWITIYTITHAENDKLPYTLNVIDTPGFGDTRGIKRDNMLIDQIAELFKSRDTHEIDSIDAVCFVAKAPDARLTPTQRYIFDSILAVFGNDIQDNILVMITFADGAKAPVLEAIKTSKLPYRKSFPFNNSALFTDNGTAFNESTTVSAIDNEIVASPELGNFARMFWTMGEDSFKTFFDFLNNLEPKSLCLTKEVLEQRRSLRDTLSFLEEKVRTGIATMSELQNEIKVFERNKQRIEDNKDFEYTVTEYFSEKVDCEPGRNVTHCMICHNTCHAHCYIRDDDGKAHCWAMGTDGNCTRCKLRCIWSDHKNTGYFLKTKSKKVKQTYHNKLKEYEEASGIAASKFNIIEMTQAKYLQHQYDAENYVNRCRDILQRLRDIALKPDPLSNVEYIEMLIQSERQTHADGWQDRVNELRKFKMKAQTIENINAKQRLLGDIAFHS